MNKDQLKGWLRVEETRYVLKELHLQFDNALMALRGKDNPHEYFKQDGIVSGLDAAIRTIEEIAMEDE